MKASYRADAHRNGQSLYFTGTSCKHGHTCARRTATGVCVECERIRQKTPKSREYHRQISSTKKYVEQRKRYRASIANTELYKERTRAIHLKNKYNLTLEQHHAMYTSQEGKCAICSKQMEIHNRQTNNSCVVDHNHKTGKVRNLLCGQCNRMLGQANDNIEILEHAISYLKEHQ